MSTAKLSMPFLSHYAQKYIMEKYANKPVQDDGVYEDQLFAVLDGLCDRFHEVRLDRAELIALASDGGAQMWRST
jgi:hypothetical protein